MKTPKLQQGKPVYYKGYNIYPSAVGAQSLSVTIPEVTVTGRRTSPVYVTQPQPQAEINQREDVNPISNAVNQYTRELKYDLENGRVPNGKYTWPAVVLGGQVAGMSLPTFVSTTAGGYAGDRLVNAGTKFVTGKSWVDNIHNITGLDKDVAEMTNPGTFYGSWVGNNIRNLGRYTLNYLNPRGYGNYIARLKDVYTKPFYTSPPTFHNGRKPTWYTGSTGDEVRFQNGAIWANILEEEIPRTLIKKNADGKTYRWTREALESGPYGKSGVDLVGGEGLSSQKVINETLERQANGEALQDADYFTTVGGEHSDYKVLKDFPQGTLWELHDEQKLNPQWMISNELKKGLHTKSLSYKLTDKIGGVNLSYLLGYKPFTYRQGIGVLKDGSNRTIYFDPTHWEQTGTIVPE